MARIGCNRGFTLIELMVVIAIGGIVSAITIAGMVGWRGERRLNGAARNFASDMQLARMAAIREAEDVSVVINAAGGSYRIFVDLNGDYTFGANDRELRNISLASGITISSSTFAGGRTQFNNRGRPNVLGTLTFTNSAGSNLKVVLSKMGRLRIE